MWDLYVDYSSSAVQHTCTVWHAYFSEAYANNAKCVHTKFSVYIVDSSGFIGGIYTDIEVSHIDIN